MAPIEIGIIIILILLIIYSFIGIIKPYWMILLSRPINWMLFGLMSLFTSSRKNVKNYDVSKKEIDEYQDKNVIMHKGNIYKKSDLISESNGTIDKFTKRLFRLIRIFSTISLITLIITFIYINIFII